MYKAIICDLDGTLLNSEHTISDYTKSVIKRVQEKGIKFFIATGRHHKDAVVFKKMLGLDSVLITSNGAKVHDENDNEIVSHNISPKLTSEIISMPLDKEIHRNIFQDDLWFVEEDLEGALEFHTESGFNYIKKDFNLLKGEEVTKFFFMCDNVEKIRLLEEELIEKFRGEFNIVPSLPICLEIMQRGVSKGTAVKEILEKEGLRLDEAVAFGDGLNDFDMLSTVGKGLIMGNCNYRLSDSLPDNEIIDTNDNEGVARYLEKLFLS